MMEIFSILRIQTIRTYGQRKHFRIINENGTDEILPLNFQISKEINQIYVTLYLIELKLINCPDHKLA